ncbi:MAG: ABC transporter permease [Rhizomicrobium sp.]
MAKRRGGFGLFLYAVFYLAFLYVPVLFLPLFSFNNSTFIAFPLSGFTTQWYGQMFADEAVQPGAAQQPAGRHDRGARGHDAGAAAAKALTRYRVPGGSAVLGLANLSLFIPEIVLGISLLILLSVLGIPLSLWTVTLGHVVICVPFAITVLMSRMEGFDKSLEEASLDLGESGWMTFWRVTFPLILPGVISSLLLSFMVSFDDFLIAYFLVGNDATLPIYIWGQLRFPYKLPSVLALGAMILVHRPYWWSIAEVVRSYA